MQTCTTNAFHQNMPDHLHAVRHTSGTFQQLCSSTPRLMLAASRRTHRYVLPSNRPNGCKDHTNCCHTRPAAAVCPVGGSRGSLALSSAEPSWRPSSLPSAPVDDGCPSSLFLCCWQHKQHVKQATMILKPRTSSSHTCIYHVALWSTAS